MALLMRVRTAWSGLATGLLSTHYFGPVPGAETTADIQACVDRIRDFWTAMAPRINSGSTAVVQGQVDVIQDTDGQLFDSHVVTSRSIPTSNVGDPCPFQTQGILAWNTSTIVAGHRLRGRTFIPLPSETDSVSGSPNATYLTALGAAATAALVPGLMNLSIWHRPVFDAGGTLTRPGSQGPVTSGVGRGYWGVLRSRR